jgi:hypothetical protein
VRGGEAGDRCSLADQFLRRGGCLRSVEQFGQALVVRAWSVTGCPPVGLVQADPLGSPCTHRMKESVDQPHRVTPPRLLR